MKKLLLIILISTSAFAQTAILDKQNAVNNFEPHYTKFNINNISTYIYNNGKADYTGANSGFVFPKGSGKDLVFTS